MLITNQNIEAIQVKDIHSVHVFAREKNQLPVCLRNSQGLRDSWNIGLQIMTNSTFEESYAPSVKALEELRVLVPWTPVFRGLQKIPRLKIQSRFPFGMLRAWKYYEVTASVTVFPERKGQLDLPASTGGIDQDETKFETDTKGYFRDFRLYQKTDNPNRIDWKRSLKHQKHLVKNYEAEAAGEKKVLIDWDLTANLQNFEDRISQLALWIDEAQRKHEFYSLKISNMQTGYELSLNHYKHCMQILALLQPKDII